MLSHSLLFLLLLLRPDSKEQFIRRCRRITQEIDESCLDVEHQFLTVGDMEEKGYSQFLILKETFYQTNLPQNNGSFVDFFPHWVTLSTLILGSCCCYKVENRWHQGVLQARCFADQDILRKSGTAHTTWPLDVAPNFQFETNAPATDLAGSQSTVAVTCIGSKLPSKAMRGPIAEPSSN